MEMKRNVERKNVSVIHGGEKVSSLKVSGMSQCLIANAKDLGLSLTRNDAGEFVVKSGSKTLTFSEEDFAPYKQFLEDVCYMVEYAKIHINNWDNNAVIYHLKSYMHIISSPHSEFFMNFFKKALAMFKNKIDKNFRRRKGRLHDRRLQGHHRLHANDRKK